jgi:hypothetical protein
MPTRLDARHLDPHRSQRASATGSSPSPCAGVNPRLFQSVRPRDRRRVCGRQLSRLPPLLPDQRIQAARQLDRVSRSPPPTSPRWSSDRSTPSPRPRWPPASSSSPSGGQPGSRRRLRPSSAGGTSSPPASAAPPSSPSCAAPSGPPHSSTPSRRVRRHPRRRRRRPVDPAQGQRQPRRRRPRRQALRRHAGAVSADREEIVKKPPAPREARRATSPAARPSTSGQLRRLPRLRR